MIRADGTLTVVGDVAIIAFQRRLRHPVETVWAALTDPTELAAWLGPGTMEPSAGGLVSIRTGPSNRPERQSVMSGRVLTWDPPRLLEHEWAQPGLEISVVRYELVADGGETVLKFTHRRSVAPGGTGGRAGWHAYLDRLAAHLDGLPIPAWADRRTAVQGEYGEAPTWTGLSEGGGA